MNVYEEVIPIDDVKAREQLLLASLNIPPVDGVLEKVFSHIEAQFSFYHPFYHRFFINMRRWPDPRVKTAGVRVKGGRIFLTYNPEWLALLSVGGLKYLIRHEIHHVALQHCTTRRSTDPSKHKIDNEAMDLAINSELNAFCASHSEYANVPYIDGKRQGLHPDMYGYPELQSYPFYLEKLLERESDPSKKPKEDEEEEVPFDSHDEWEDCPAGSQLVSGIVDQIQTLGLWGNVPGAFKAEVIAAQKTQVPWEKQFKFSLGTLGSHNSVQTRSRAHYVLGYDAPGRTKTGRDDVLIAIDTSASVSDEELGIFMGEVNAFDRKLGCVYWCTFDTEIHQEDPLKWRRSSDIEVSGRGGTDFSPIFEKVSSGDWRMKKLVIMSDGFCSYPSLPDGVSVVWVITKGGMRPSYDESTRCRIVMMN